MCLRLACRQVLQRPTAFVTSRGQLVLTELLNYRHTCADSLSDRKKAERSTFLRTGCHTTFQHCEALHASMTPTTTSKANSDFNRSSAPVWIDCDAGSDDALGIACLLVSPQKHSLVPMQQHIISLASAGIILAARANVVGVSPVRGNAVGTNRMCSC